MLLWKVMPLAFNTSIAYAISARDASTSGTGRLANSPNLSGCCCTAAAPCSFTCMGGARWSQLAQCQNLHLMLASHLMCSILIT